MDKYVIAPPEGSTNNSVGASDRPWKEGHFDSVKLNGGDLGEYLAESTGYGIVSGCEPSISGLTVTVGAGVVHLADGTRKEIAETSITLDSADSTNPRIDLVYITADGTLAKITGTAAASPSAPSVPSGGVSVCTITIAVGASAGTLTDSRNIVTQLQSLPFVNVKDFGAKGDNATDDTNAFALALKKSEYIYVPKGSYKIKGLDITKDAYIIGGDNAVISPIASSASRYYTMMSANGGYSIVFDNIRFVGLGTLPSENINPIPAFSFNGLESLTCRNCYFGDFYQAGYELPVPAFASFIPSLMLNVDCSISMIDQCEFGTNCGGLEIWIERDSAKTNTQFTIRNSIVNPSVVTPFDINKKICNSLHNIYIADYDTYSAGASFLNLFSDVVNIDGDYWDGNAYNMYDNTEAGMVKGKVFNAKDVSVSSSFTVDSPFLVNAQHINISNIYISCRAFIGVECKQTYAQLWNEYNLNIINCFVRSTGYAVMVGYGTTALDININVQSSALLPQTLESNDYVGMFYLARPGVNLKVSDSRIRCTKPFSDSAYSMFYVDVNGHSLNAPADVTINNCQIQTYGTAGATRLFTIKQSTNACNAFVNNCYSSVAIGSITDDYSKVSYKASNNKNIDDSVLTTAPATTVGSFTTFKAQRINNYVTITFGLTVSAELAANTTLFTVPEKYRLNDDYTYIYEMFYDKRLYVDKNGICAFTDVLQAGTYFIKLTYPAK